MEAIKSAVQYGLGAALVSTAAIAKEMDLGLFRKLDIAGVRLTRTLSLVRSSCYQRDLIEPSARCASSAGSTYVPCLPDEWQFNLNRALNWSILVGDSGKLLSTAS